MSWACLNEIVNGISDTEFAPDTGISREQMAAILYRYAKYKQLDISKTQSGQYTDMESISDYAVDAVLWALGKNIMVGSDGYFSPKNGATRAEAAAVFVRISELFNEIK